VLLVGFIIRNYHDAQSSERQRKEEVSLKLNTDRTNIWT